jgi:predicted DCC family thiol-disulfide oxidoreductase YuxK
VSAFLWIPPRVRDAFYDVIARNRYRWFGRRDVCALPTADRRWEG